MRFCNQCGSGLGAQPADPAAPAPVQRAETVAERRFVSVLFADLVGFTPLSETRDAEDVRELLSRYFEQARKVIERYGGTVEKFIGDAVMAVWGAPVAQEDDAERAVRAALDLVGAVPELDGSLKVRAGVLTGEAAVTMGAQDQGMVAGDLVNTASRVQAAAEAGTVLVGDSTKRASEAAIAYEDAGVRELKGKAEPVQLWRAQRVVAGAGGALRSTGLEAPFVGRDRELRLVKELFHASADEQRAQLVSVSGIAGIGKSRLSWEFEKYIDGLAETIFWHRGRCLSYGEGVAYWALAEMVRMRCGIFEDEDPATALRKLRAAIAEHVPDPDEQRWVEPRLAHLLGLEEGASGDQENLFSAWRILFERLAEERTVVLVFEDMQWADEGLLDFLEYLLEWSRAHPLFVLVLARPELADKRASWGAGKRSFASLYLEPLAPQAMSELLTGLVPGLPEDLRDRILERSEGVPLYAVETVRMLIDRGVLVQEGTVYRPAGSVETLEVPETLHALVAARLDSLAPVERRLVQDAAVLGKTFTKAGLLALDGSAEAELDALLAALLRKEIVSIQADPRSPERGQYSFLQDIVRHVAYETLSRHERKAKHVAAAEFLSGVWSAEEDEIVEVVAAHYLDAYEAAPQDDDAEQIRAKARDMVVRAGERAASLAANTEAQRAFERAIDLTDDPLVQAGLHERAGVMALAATRADDAVAHFERSIELNEANGATHPAARVSAELAVIMWDRGRIEHGLEIMDRSFEILSREEPDADLAELAAQLGRFRFFAGDREVAMQRIETALEIAEALVLPEILAQALNTKSTILMSRGRRNEGLTLLRHALEVALEHDKPSAALRAYYNLADSLDRIDQYEEADRAVTAGLALARRVGNRYWEWLLLGQGYPAFAVGRWDEVLAVADEIPEERWTETRQAIGALLSIGVAVCAHRGRLDEGGRITETFVELEDSADEQERASYLCGRSRLLLARGESAEALSRAETAFATRAVMGIDSEYVKESFVIALEAALALGDTAKADELLGIVEALPAGDSSHFLRAQTDRFRARLAILSEAPARAEDLFKRAAGLFGELPFAFYAAVTRLEFAEWLVAQGRGDEAEPLLAEARDVFEGVGATPWLERTSSALAGGTQALSVS